jgi:N-acylglucosamine-6-phosphate 2-epimerase
MSFLEEIRDGLIVSVQAWPGSAIDDPHVLAAMALAAQENGAAAVRMQGVANLRAARERVDIPIIGIIKREYEGFGPYITPTLDEVREIAETGTQIIAFDATSRPRPRGITVEDIVAAIHVEELLAMADCSNAADGLAARAAEADILATTLCGYTDDTKGTPLPALDLVDELRQLDVFVIAEGGVGRPEDVEHAFSRGANAVVVGTAITNIDWLVREFASRTPKGGKHAR